MHHGSGYQDLDEDSQSRDSFYNVQALEPSTTPEPGVPSANAPSPANDVPRTRRRSRLPLGMSMAFCSSFNYRFQFFRSLSKERMYALAYFFMGPLLLFLTLAIGAHNHADSKMVYTIGVTLLMIDFWLFEVLPIGVTSFIPVVLFPIMGVVSGDAISEVYMSDQVIILFGSCVLAAAVEEYALHRRLALGILRRTGNSPYKLVLGFLFVTAFLSMWLSNTATASMMAPLATAVMETLTSQASHRVEGAGRAGELSVQGGDDDTEEEDAELAEIRGQIASTDRLPDGATSRASGDGRVSQAGGGVGPAAEKAHTARLPVKDGPVGRDNDLVEIGLWNPEENGVFESVTGGRRHTGTGHVKARSVSVESVGTDYWCGIKVDAVQLSISLAICFGASLGGMATLTGTGTNLVLNGVLASNFPDAVPISFGSFFCIAAPISFFCLLALWLYLCWRMRMESSVTPHGWSAYAHLAIRNCLPNGYQPPRRHHEPAPEASPENTTGRGDESSSAVNEFEKKYANLPPLSFEEKVVLADFLFMALLWFFRDPKGYPGWSSISPRPEFVTDGTVAMLGALILFMIPRREYFAQRRSGSAGGRSSPPPGADAFGVVPWDLVLRSMPWNVLFLVGGGLALSLAYKESNLSRAIATAFGGLARVPFPVVEASVCLVTILISNFISNVATANIILPPLGCISVHLGRHPLALMLPATLAGSFSFVSVIGTPANAIAYSMGHLTMADLAHVGFILTIMSVVVLSLLFQPLFSWIVDGTNVPAWAQGGC